MSLVIQYAIDAVTLSGLYAILALGIALIFGIMRLINFAHGELIMIGGYALLFLTKPPILIQALATIAVVVVFALAMERVAFRPVRNASPATLLVTSFALSYFLQNLTILIFGARAKSAEVSPFLVESFSVGSIDIPWLDVVTVSLTIVIVVGLTMFLKRTALGIQMRAAAEDFTMARHLGVRANRVIATAFALSGVLAGIASFLLVAQTGTVTANMGTVPVVIAFVATVIGGMGSLPGAVLGGAVLGTLATVLQASLPVELRPFRDAFVYLAVLIILVVRPQGLIIVRSARARV
jgi:branched-chain amino acid transport system permease protein